MLSARAVVSSLVTATEHNIRRLLARITTEMLITWTTKGLSLHDNENDYMGTDLCEVFDKQTSSDDPPDGGEADTVNRVIREVKVRL